MASAWGSSWASAWGDSWGAGTTPAVTSLHGRPIRKPRRWRGPEYEAWIRRRIEAGDLPGIAADVKEQIQVAQVDDGALKVFAEVIGAARQSLVEANARFAAVVEMVAAAEAQKQIRVAELKRAADLAALIQQDEEEAAFMLLFQ